MAPNVFKFKGASRNIAQRICDHYLYRPITTSKSRTSKYLRYPNLWLFMNHALALPNLLIITWVVLLFWGEIWIFNSSVKRCDWSNWETWSAEASPHHLIFLADPQLIDPHSYPSRPWPLDWLTVKHTDKYLKRSYISLQKILHPDTVFFVGDLFDGGREWKASRSSTKDAPWGDNQRPFSERPYAKIWAEKYGEDFWLREYDRFGKIFYKFWNEGGLYPGPWQRGRKIISSLPGNHDLGFGDNIKMSVRNRFQAYFGELNRVDVIGNHTFVSVDSVSLSASESTHDASEITKPVDEFLATVKILKRRTVARELGYMKGKDSMVQYVHKIEDLATANFTSLPILDPGPGLAEFPTILLTHVPLYREPGTPCGPLRERWPPITPPKGQSSPVAPDERNSISISRGYQYQNVLSSSDSIRLISSIGNVSWVFSGDDHDYCEIQHHADKNNVKEITIKSISWAMGIRRPGFLLLSMWNPVDDLGRPLQTFQPNGHFSSSQRPLTADSHLCLLPDQIGVLTKYFILLFLSLFAIILRSILTPILHLEPFASKDKTLYLPLTYKKPKNKTANSLFRASFSLTSPSRKVNMASRANTSRVTHNVVNRFSIGSDNQAWDSITPKSSISVRNSFHNIEFDQIIEEPDEYFDKCKDHMSCIKKSRIFDSEVEVSRSMISNRTVIFREAITSIWRVTWVVILMYLFLFNFF